MTLTDAGALVALIDKNQIPPDFVVNSQHIDIADVILWLALPPHFVYPRKIEGSAASHPLKAAVHH